jgi:hypothetical protein
MGSPTSTARVAGGEAASLWPARLSGLLLDELLRQHALAVAAGLLGAVPLVLLLLQLQRQRQVSVLLFMLWR